MPEKVDCSAALARLCTLAERPDEMVSWRAGQPLRAADLAAQAAQWRATLARGPVEQPVAVYFHDSFAAAAALLGAWFAGRTVVLPADTQAQTVRRLQDELKACLVGDFAGARSTPAVAAADQPPPQLDAGLWAVVVFTSGSTGEPVALRKTLGQLLAEIGVLQALWQPLLSGRTVVATVSHQHVYGLLFRLLLPLVMGVPFVAERLEYPEEVQACLGLRPSVLVSSPAFLKRLPEGSAWPPGAAAVFSSGGPLGVAAAARAEALLRAPVIEVFGSSETGGIAWRQQRRGAHWQPLPGVEIGCANGLLRVRSPWTQDGDWHQGADRVRMHAEGFELDGRADRLVKIEEKRISLDGIEACLRNSSAVTEARVVVLPGERVRLGAVIVLSREGQHRLQQGKRLLNDQLRQHLLQDVERVALPRYWRYVDTLPVNALGKTTQAALRALFDDAHASVRYPPVLHRVADEHTVVLDLVADAGLAWFDGHFPALPVLPGVAMLDWAEHFARQHFELPPDLLRMDAVKFQKIIVPASRVRLELEWLPERSAVGFRVTSSAGPHASGRLIFGVEHAD